MPTFSDLLSMPLPHLLFPFPPPYLQAFHVKLFSCPFIWTRLSLTHLLSCTHLPFQLPLLLVLFCLPLQSNFSKQCPHSNDSTCILVTTALGLTAVPSLLSCKSCIPSKFTKPTGIHRMFLACLWCLKQHLSGKPTLFDFPTLFSPGFPPTALDTP